MRIKRSTVTLCIKFSQLQPGDTFIAQKDDVTGVLMVTEEMKSPTGVVFNCVELQSGIVGCMYEQSDVWRISGTFVED